MMGALSIGVLFILGIGVVGGLVVLGFLNGCAFRKWWAIS